jgi:hypothetical protein
MDRPPSAIVDACVLYSAPVRDLVVRLAQAGLLQARWTDDIHDEWMRNVLKNNLCEAVQLQRTSLKNPPITVPDFLAKLKEVGLPQTAARLRNYADRL